MCIYILQRGVDGGDGGFGCPLDSFLTLFSEFFNINMIIPFLHFLCKINKSLKK